MGAVARVGAVALVGLTPHRIHVECVTTPGLPGTTLLGRPDRAVQEAADRVKSAVRRAALPWPDIRVLINLAPADVPKVGTGFDLPIALAAIAAQDKIPLGHLDGVVACGELGLDGRLRAVPGMFTVARAAVGATSLIVPAACAGEAALATDVPVFGVHTLAEAVALVRGDEMLPRATPANLVAGVEHVDLAQVRGQQLARRALEIAAAGEHHLLFRGPPGCGKSMLARRLPTVMPTLGAEEALEVAAVHSIAGVRDPESPVSMTPPFRDPHPGISAAGLIGGGSGIARPGELSLAHRGVLFLDELLETPRSVLDALRAPLESGQVRLVRSQSTVRYPSRTLLVAATNPCPCGWSGSTRACTCRPDRVRAYQERLSGPLLDRLDLRVDLRPVDADALLGAPDGEPSSAVAARVVEARAGAAERWRTQGVGPARNRDVAIGALRASTERRALRRLADAVEVLGLTARAFDRSLRVARTIADLAGATTTGIDHVEEALAHQALPIAVPA